MHKAQSIRHASNNEHQYRAAKYYRSWTPDAKFALLDQCSEGYTVNYHYRNNNTRHNS